MITRQLKYAYYVTFIFTISVITPPISAETIDKSEIPQLIKDLGADGFRIRKSAVKKLIQIGFHSKDAVKQAMKSDDPEVKENARAVWAQIKDILTPNNSPEVQDFLEKLNRRAATSQDWQKVIEANKDNILTILIKVHEKLNLLKPQEQEVNFEDEGLIDNGPDPFAENEAVKNKVALVNSLLLYFTPEQLSSELSKLNKGEQKLFLDIALEEVRNYSSYEKKLLFSSISTIISPNTSWPFITEMNLKSSLELSAIDNHWISSLSKSLKKSDNMARFTLMHLQVQSKSKSSDDLKAFLKENDLVGTDLDHQFLYYHFYKETLGKEYWINLYKNSLLPWQQIIYLQEEGTLSKQELKGLNTKTLRTRFQTLSLVDNFFYFRDPRAIELFKHSTKVKQDKPSNLYDENDLLIMHYANIGDYKSAIKRLKHYNKVSGRTHDSNLGLYTEQQEIIKKETIALLKQVYLEQDNIKKLELLNKAAKINPQIASIFIQKAKLEVALQKNENAKISMKKAVQMIPDNALEIHELIFLSYDLNDQKFAESQLKRLQLDEINVMNCILASSAYEFFGNEEQAAQVQEIMSMTHFGNSRLMFYQGQYSQVAQKCSSPEEGDFQYLWGISATLLAKGPKEAKAYKEKYKFYDAWAETIAYMMIGKISPEELIKECRATYNQSDILGRLTEAYYYIGCTFLKSDKNKAKTYFQKSIDLKFREYYEYVSASAMLKKIK
ncbi:MAG: hypothetical protein NE334_08410 [Lentisphaeraceae bacterium]|nr:hypothetical protein [Lentisphaeraceae bacterium]